MLVPSRKVMPSVMPCCWTRSSGRSQTPKPDRTLVEDHALLGAEGPTLRDLGRDRASRRTRNRLLERAQTSLHLGPSPASSDAPSPRPRRYPRYLKNLADAPLRAWSAQIEAIRAVNQAPPVQIESKIPGS